MTRHLSILLLLSSFMLTSANAATFKKWVDENGVVHYGTSIPQRYSGQGHTELNERGIAVEHAPKAKSKEERARERALEELRAEQRRELEEQQAADRVLLNMFRTEDDLVMARDGKIAQVDAQIMVKQKQIERLKERLAKWQAVAAEAERKGSDLNAKQQENLNNTQSQIEVAYADIVQKEANKQKISSRFNQDLDRLRELRNRRLIAAEADKEKKQETPYALVESAILCTSDAECERLFPQAVAYGLKYATTPVQVQGERIMMTRAARERHDVSITVSRISTDGQERIFLDVQCQRSVSGRVHCEKPEVQKIRRNFRATLQDTAR